MGKNLYCFKTSSYLVHFMFVFTLQIAMATVTMEIFWSFVKHHFLIVVVPILNQIIKKQYVVVKNYVTIAWFSF